MLRSAFLGAIFVAAIIPGASARVVNCPGAYYAQRLNGELIIVCPSPPIPPEEREKAERAWLDSWRAEQTRLDSLTKCDERPLPPMAWKRCGYAPPRG